MPQIRCTRLIRVSVLLFSGFAVLSTLATQVKADSFYTTNLVTDDQSVNHAQITDPHLVNAWGISASSSSPFWVSSNGGGISTLYSVNPTTGVTTKVPLEVTIPNAGNVTGQVFNGGSQFNGDRFLFVSEDGTISGWRGALVRRLRSCSYASADNSYKGSAIATVGTDTYLYAANFKTGKIDVLKGNPGAPGSDRQLH